MMNRTSPAVLALLLTLCFIHVGTARADVYGSIRGTVTDPTGAAVPGVTLTATNMATNASKQVTSGDDGTYNFLELAIGDYSVKAEKGGFQTFSVARVHLDVNTVYVQDIKLEIGNVSQAITVEASSAQVETSTTQLSTVVGAQEIEDLPLLGRNWLQLQQLQPGVVGGSDRFGAGAGGTDFATNGGQSQFNVFLIDGTDTNDQVLNTTTFTPSEDAVSEFRMVTSTLNPEYARTSGAVMNAVIKSGTNSFHGDAFEFYRTRGFDAANPFTAPAEPGGPILPDPFHENEYGGTIGGPIIKNHLFAFFSYQGFRENVPQTSNGVNNGTEVTPVFLSGQTTDATAFPGLSSSTGTSPFPLVGDDGTTYPAGTAYGTIFRNGTIPTADINTVSQKLLAFVPAPNIATTAGGPLDAYSFNASESAKDSQYLYRIDQVFNAKDSVWGTWFNESLPDISTVPFFGATLPGFSETDGDTSKFLSMSWTHVFNDHMLNELHGGYNRFNFVAVEPASPTLPSSVGFSITPQLPGAAGLPVISPTGLFTLGFSQYGPQPRIDQVYQGGDNFQIVEGRHTLKIGFDMRRWETRNPFGDENSGDFQFQPYGTYSTGNSGVDFLLGIPSTFVQASGSFYDGRARQYYSYAQDQFKWHPNLTLTYGLGWTIDTPAINTAFGGHGQVAFVANQQSIVFPGAPLGVVYAGDPGVHAAGEFKPFKDFGPRLGIVYSPNRLAWLTGGPGKMSIRAGFGIYYDRSETEQADQVVGMPPFAITSQIGVTSAGGGVLGVNPSFSNPFKDIATGATVTNPFPFAGPPATVNFSQPGFEPIWGTCCASVAPTLQDPMAENYNLTIERQLTNSTLLSVGYVGSVAHHLAIGLPQNLVTGLDASDNPINLYNPSVYGSIDTINSIGNSNYNSLQVGVTQHLSHGLYFQASYTYGHSLDEGSGFENTSFGTFGGQSGGYGGSIRASNPYCFPRCDYASSIFDARQRLVISYAYQIPGMRGNWWVSRLTKGWTISGITTFQTGFPLDVADLNSPSGGCDGLGDFSCWDGPDQIAPVHYLDPRSAGHPWIDPSSFQEVPCASAGTPPTFVGCPANGVSPTSIAAYGNAPRNVLRGPGINNWNMTLYKDTAITERTKVQLRLDSFNTFNHTQFDPNGISGNVSSPLFGVETAARDPRLLQVAAKFIF
jgi:Carboxypeptidase regulatory-like domain